MYILKNISCASYLISQANSSMHIYRMRTMHFSDGTSAARVRSKSQAVLTLHAHGHRPGGTGKDP